LQIIVTGNTSEIPDQEQGQKGPSLFVQGHSLTPQSDHSPKEIIIIFPTDNYLSCTCKLEVFVQTWQMCPAPLRTGKPDIRELVHIISQIARSSIQGTPMIVSSPQLHS
jgi:hypothetical protein